LCATRAQAAPDYAQPGPLAYSTSPLATIDGGVQGGSLVVPSGAGPYPLLIASHGWSAGSAQQLGWAEHFATYGFVVVVPTLPNSLSPDANLDASLIEGLIAKYASAGTSSPAQGLVDPARIGLEGHSAGGLATTIASRQLQPGATVLFDPVDANDAGRAAYEDLCRPVLALFADPSGCNNQAEWSSFATNTTSASTTFHVIGSSHCDGENPDRGALCGLACNGAANATRQAVYARYATAFFLWTLRDDAQAATVLTQSALAADTAITTLTSTSGACAVASDGGSAPPPAPSDSGSPDDAGPTDSPPASPTSGSVDASVGDAQPPASPAARGGTPNNRSSGCGCSLYGQRGAGTWSAGIFGFFALCALTRRRKSPA
jgi:dienelactone hydrolase